MGMTEPNRYGELEARLTEERLRLEGVRSDYDVITQSRFHAMRMLWFSLKAFLGFSTANDVCATWSKGITPSLAGRRAYVRRNDAVLPDAEGALVEAWSRRVAARTISDPPIATVVIPVFNHRDVTARCLESIAETWFE